MRTQEIKLSVSILDLLDLIKNRIEKSDSIIPTPFSALNRALDGGIRGMSCIGAAPGYGKSAMSQQIAIHAAMSGIPVIYVDLEHGLEFLLLRFFSSANSATIETVKEKLLNNTLNLHPMLKLLTLLTGKVSPLDIQHSILALGGEDALTLVVIDSIQKLPMISGVGPRESANLWARELEYIKNTYPVVILAISELARGEGGRNYQNPYMGALKESGDLEYTFEQILLLSKIQGERGAFQIEIAKNRYGLSGKLKGVVYTQKNFCFWQWNEESNI